MSTHDYDKAGVKASTFARDIQADGTIGGYKFLVYPSPDDADKYRVHFTENTLTTPEIAALDGIHTAATNKLDDAKAGRRAEVRAKTGTLLAAGASHSGKTFGLDAESLSRLQVLHSCRNVIPSEDYPKAFEAADGSVLSLADATAVEGLADAMWGRHLAVVGGEADLLGAIDDASNQTELDAVSDDRS